MRKIFFQVFLVLLFIISISAQANKQEPILIDEFGKINAEENFARLDFLNSELSKTENAKAVIRISGGDENCFMCHYRQGSYATSIVKSRRHSIDKYSIEYCTANEELRVQLYVMPMNTQLSACNKTLAVPKCSALFDTIHFFYNNKLTPLEDTYVESTSPADGEYSQNALKAVKQILDKSPGSKIYIIVYLGTNSEIKYEEKNGESVEKNVRKLDKKSLAEKMRLNANNELIKNGIDSLQIETIIGGYVDEKRRMEFWFVPKGGEIPKPKPDYFPRKRVRKKK